MYLTSRMMFNAQLGEWNMAQYLILGAGLVVGPVVEYLSRRPDNILTIASHIAEEAEAAAASYTNANAMVLDVMDEGALREALVVHDVVISLVPPAMHVRIAKACIAAKTPMVNASYQSAELSSLDQEAKRAGICILSEIGLDPGIDHLSALKIIDDVHDKGEDVEAFVSWCGGLPAPEYNDNPLGYKFSWEPKGAIRVLLNTATYLRDGKSVEINGRDLMANARPLRVSDMDLECYPNRNSLSYQDIYNIAEAKTLLRGTLRYAGFCAIFERAKSLRLMELESGDLPDQMSWRQYLQWLNPEQDFQALSNEDTRGWQAFEWLGLFSDQPIQPHKMPIDVFCAQLLHKLSYGEGEQDMIVLQHKFVIKRPDGSRYFISSVLKQIGEAGGHSAMARTVGYPVGIASEMIADGIIKETGAIRPVSRSFYPALFAAIMKEGICFEETVLDTNKLSVGEFLSEL